MEAEVEQPVGYDGYEHVGGEGAGDDGEVLPVSAAAEPDEKEQYGESDGGAQDEGAEL